MVTFRHSFIDSRFAIICLKHQTSHRTELSKISFQTMLFEIMRIHFDEIKKKGRHLKPLSMKVSNFSQINIEK